MSQRDAQFDIAPYLTNRPYTYATGFGAQVVLRPSPFVIRHSSFVIRPYTYATGFGAQVAIRHHTL